MTKLTHAAAPLVRDLILDAMRNLLLKSDWSAITLADVARAAGVSRQTIYNEFGSRHGLAQGYALRLADRLVDSVEVALAANTGDTYQTLLKVFQAFFAETRADPLIISMWTGVAKPDLLQLIATDSGPVVARASGRLSMALARTCPVAGDDDAGILSRAIVRLGLSYVSTPPEANHDVAADLAKMMTPFAEATLFTSAS